MTVTFDIVDHEWPVDVDGCALPPASMFLQMSNVNAAAFFRWVPLEFDVWAGAIPARELAALLRRRLWPERRGAGDTGISPDVRVGSRGACVIDCGRAPGKLAEYA